MYILIDLRAVRARFVKPEIRAVNYEEVWKKAFIIFFSMRGNYQNIIKLYPS